MNRPDDPRRVKVRVIGPGRVLTADHEYGLGETFRTTRRGADRMVASGFVEEVPTLSERLWELVGRLCPRSLR